MRPWRHCVLSQHAHTHVTFGGHTGIKKIKKLLASISSLSCDTLAAHAYNLGRPITSRWWRVSYGGIDLDKS